VSERALRGLGAAAAGLLVVLAGCQTPPRQILQRAGPAPVEYVAARWADLPGWNTDSVLQAWPAVLSSCRVHSRADWNEICAAAAQLAPASDREIRAFFVSRFQPLRVIHTGPTAAAAQTTGLLTGYYEPQLRGSRMPRPGFDTPLYSPPDDLLTVDLGAIIPELKGKRVRGRLVGKTVVPYYAREQLPADPALQGHEIVWLDSALDAFLLEVQGSGRIQLEDGTVIRLGYADQNGQPYRSIGRYLVNQQELTVAQASMPGIRAWLAAHPERLHEVLDSNPSVVFFQEQPLGDPALGPRGAQGIPLTPGRSIAVDPAYIPLGSPVYLQTSGATSLQRLVVAQDTGGAISGAPRADFFCGTGDAAASMAGNLRAQVSMWLLWPRDVPLQNSRQTR
jgi:membrane-bound lytic murein transglycosylase A